MKDRRTGENLDAILKLLQDLLLLEAARSRIGRDAAARMAGVRTSRAAAVYALVRNGERRKP
jgi:hypothetical protein